MHAPLNAGAICTRTVTIAYPGMALNEAARLMREHHVGCLVVVEQQSPEGRMGVGMPSDRDVAASAAHPVSASVSRKPGSGYPGR